MSRPETLDVPDRKVPDLATLRDLCQGEKVRQDRRLWYVLSRRVSIRITWLLLHTGVTANQVTLLSLLLTVAGAVLLAMPSAAVSLGGAAALVVHYFLDKVDGEIARFRGVYSLDGVYMDELSHTFAYAGIFAGVGLHLAAHAETPAQTLAALAPAMIGALAMVMIRQNKSMGALLYAQYGLEQPQILPPAEPSGPASLLSREAVRRSRRGEGGGPGGSLAARAVSAVRDLVLVISEFTILLLLVIIGLAIEWATGDAAFLGLVLQAQALLQVAVLLALIWINHSFNVEAECRRLNELARRRAQESRGG
ncbi:MAG TPA: CDP-alcohol phosphatidyltransferase family protein [Candidatus Eisenbacteria bacterium]|jgi:phosphatidylglycerophosphate synthase